MKRSLLRNHLVAWIAAVVFAYPSGFVLVALAPPNLVLEQPLVGLPRLLIPSVLAPLFIWRLAVLLGPYDLLVIIPGGLAVALSFGLSYSMDIQSFLPDDGHTFFDVFTFGSRPFYFLGQFRIFSFLLIWAAAMVWGGIALKRWGQARSATEKADSVPLALNQKERQRMGLWLAFDLGLMVCLTFVILRVEIANRVAQGKPEYFIQTLLSPTSPDNERLHAIGELSSVKTDESTQALRRAAREQQPPVNVMAAATLLLHNDISELPLLEDICLRHSSQLEQDSFQTIVSNGLITSSLTGSHSGPINLESYLGCIRDPAAIPSLIHLMTSPNVGTRRGTAHALRNIASPATMDVLIKGLDDSDIEVRYYSTCTLIKIAGDGHYPARDRYDLNEESYLDHWKTWAKERLQTKP